MSVDPSLLDVGPSVAEPTDMVGIDPSIGDDASASDGGDAPSDGVFTTFDFGSDDGADGSTDVSDGGDGSVEGSDIGDVTDGGDGVIYTMTGDDGVIDPAVIRSDDGSEDDATSEDGGSDGDGATLDPDDPQIVQTTAQPGTESPQSSGVTPIHLGEGADAKTGTALKDFIAGHGGDDTIAGAAGGDMLRGSEGDDKLDGGVGADTLRGGADDDELRGGDDADLLRGGKGDDVLFGDGGNDCLLGGEGKDTFVMTPDGHDKIVDFNPAEDILDFSTTSLTALADVADIATERGDDLVLDFGAGDMFVLKDTSLDDLTADNSVFAKAASADVI